MAYLLPASTYQAPPRQARGSKLNTIIEDNESTIHSQQSWRSGTSTSTVKAQAAPKPLTRNQMTPAAWSRRRSYQPNNHSPLSEVSEQSFGNDDDRGYESSEAGTEFSESCPSLRDSISSRPTSFATDSTRNSIEMPKRVRPTILIPQSTRASLQSPFAKSSPVPPTPPSKLMMSPAALAMLDSIPAPLSAAPSLDGSETSDQRSSSFSVPGTPSLSECGNENPWDNSRMRIRQQHDLAHDDISDTQSHQGDILIEIPENWDLLNSFPEIPGATPQERSPIQPPVGMFMHHQPQPEHGVQLPTRALSTLRHLTMPSEPNSAISNSKEKFEMEERQQSARPRSADLETPCSEMSGYSFSQLSIPSPGGFFSSLKAGTRNTWQPGKRMSVGSDATSALALNFYNCPWREEQIVEQVVEFDDQATEAPNTARQFFSPGPPTAPLTARKIVETPRKLQSPGGLYEQPTAPPCKTEFDEIRYEYEESYEKNLMQHSTANIDRTAGWLSQQSDYLSVLKDNQEPSDPQYAVEDEICREFVDDLQKSPGLEVTFVMSEPCTPVSGYSDPEDNEPIFLQAVTYSIDNAKKSDAIVQSKSRFAAVQNSRISTPERHINQLTGNFELASPTRPKYSGPFAGDPKRPNLPDHDQDTLDAIRVEREKAALQQISSPTWAVQALTYLNGGNVLASPAVDKINAFQATQDPASNKKKRILDLGGSSSCDWAWHCAHQWPNVRTYTCSLQPNKTKLGPQPLGPPNHKRVSVPCLTKLPFKDAYFDVISARTLHSMLKSNPVPGQTEIDEYDMCLKECMRVLKPGGYFEYMIMDSNITQAGPMGQKMSVEFGFNLKTRGYDPTASKAFLSRLRKAGYSSIQRAWMFLPVGAKATVQHRKNNNTDQGRGSTADVADVSGLLGSWMWEQWLVKLGIEMGRDRDHLLDGIADVIRESREHGAGWNVLKGWARKPHAPKADKPKTKKIENKTHTRQAPPAPMRLSLAEKPIMARFSLAEPPRTALPPIPVQEAALLLEGININDKMQERRRSEGSNDSSETIEFKIVGM